MHYCCLVFTSDFPTDQVLEEKLKPYNDEVYRSAGDDVPRPLILWDFWILGGRYSGMLKLHIQKEEDDFYRWQFYNRTPRSGRVFRSFLLEEVQKIEKGDSLAAAWNEEYHYMAMGARENFLFVDGARIADVLNLEDIGCYCFIDENGEAHARERYDGNQWIDNDNFDDEVKEAIERNGTGYICVVDIHD